MAASIISGIVITIGCALVGGWLGGTVGMLIAGVIGAALGFVYGRAVAVAKPYDASALGVWRFVVDHTWSLLNTVAGALYLAVHLLFGNSIDRTFSTASGTIRLKNGVVS